MIMLAIFVCLQESTKSLSFDYRDSNLDVAMYQLACLYVDIRDYQKALPLHEAVIGHLQQFVLLLF